MIQLFHQDIMRVKLLVTFPRRENNFIPKIHDSSKNECWKPVCATNKL